jgi:hypothetical protein
MLAARLRSDATGELLKWLEEVHDQPAPAAALDALLMPEALLENDHGSWRLETTRHDRVPTPSLPSPPPPPRRRWPLGVALVGIVAVGATAVGFGSPFGRGDAAPTPPSASITASVAASVESAPSAVAPPVDPPLPAPVQHVAETRARRSHATATPSALPLAPPPSDVVGTLAVRGGAYRGATIAIDGRVEPFGAPHFFELRVGKHTIELHLDGGVVSSGTIAIEPSHTPTQPLYWP